MQNYFRLGSWNVICSTCKKEQPSDNYYVRDTGKLRLQCKSCFKEKQRLWCQTNRKTLNERSRKFAKNNPEKVKEFTKKWRQANLEYDAFRTSCYRARKRNQCPQWANLEKIEEIYFNCPKGHHVDHILPLKGKLVSGLHVESNLQYLPAIENIRKRNVYKLL